MRLRDVIKFLLPEYQIIEVYKEKGFFAKKNRMQTAVPMLQRQELRGGGGLENTAPIQSVSSKPVKTAQQPQENTAAYQYKDKTKWNSAEIPGIFGEIRSYLTEDLVGQNEFLDQLMIAFKRPYITGFDGNRPKNTIFVLGGRGTGRKTGIYRAIHYMKQYRLVSSETVMKIDLASYPTVSEFPLFLSDLYKCLYGQSDAILFENFEKSHSSIIDVISVLARTGTFALRSRYVFQNNALVEATGMLVQNSISELSANGKFFIFASEKSEEDVFDVFGPKFMSSVGDVLHTTSFSKGEVRMLTLRILAELKEKCRGQLSIGIAWDEQVLKETNRQFKTSTGVNGLRNYVHEKFFMPIAEYKLRHSLDTDERVMLTHSDTGYSAIIRGKTIPLAALRPQKMAAGIEEVKRELATIIGMDAVKEYVLQLEDHLKVQQRRVSAGIQSSDISMHMIFSGNPGTGKTTIARIVAKYMKALGILSTGQLREVTRADLVGQYVGQTARLTQDAINSALGGVLFIDEAYALCRDKNDLFGLEAIDTLVKGMEDNRNDLLVILAGYGDEMEEFLKVNPGLKSRFPNLIHFEDYTSEELWKIALHTAHSKGYRIAANCEEPLLRLFDKRQIKGRNDSGNGRLVRNIVESTILNQSKRLNEDPTAELDELRYEDFQFEETGDFDLDASLAPIIGLTDVKEFVRLQHKLLIAEEKRRAAGIQMDTTQSLNMIFSGNPGTGKTTIARVVAQMFKDMGMLKSGHLVEVDRGGLVSQYVGHTAKKTEEVFRSALGGVLFIDEAYSLSSEGDSFGREAIHTLVKLIEDYRGEIVVILAGYDKEMKEFMKANTGLASRFPLQIKFPDYHAEELFRIAQKIISSKGFRLAADAQQLLEEQVGQLHKQATADSGNGRMVRNYVEEIVRNQSARIATVDVPAEEMQMIIPQDIEPMKKVDDDFDLEEQLAKIVGLDEVKGYIRGLNARLRMQNERKKLGMIVDDSQTMHMIFKGNPGTGKTMVARTVAQVLYHIGVIRTNKLIETDRADLVAGYVGQTAMKTREVVLSAMDGVLFIDEAYALAQGGTNDFGKEAIDTLVKMMDDHRDRLVVILAGYSEDMDQFLVINPGLRSRFPNVIEFSDYSTEQLLRISNQFFEGRGYVLDLAAKEKLSEILSEASKEPHFGNGRYVRNLYEKAINNQAIRLSTDPHLTREELMTIQSADLERV
ncbi:AAA family ATPase [Sporosarcina highlanderae]|uniref:AAA family ATPase n=1 Tax=Sporosarcina highlanderae TaxID=3035916 RepID=A0ABT8JVS6_9BACL|nr:AAA family ATPase [Sporosarcina highlanderae]MDN4608462.1 AAA family ATPase [Sporosarcina highlanderae]